MNNYEYYGIFLPDYRKKQLIQSVSSRFLPEDWTIYADHCTLMHHSMPASDFIPSAFLDLFLGKMVEFNVIAYGKSENALAAMVDLPSLNRISHITIAVAPGHKPVESNEIIDWTYIEPFRLSGYLDVRFRHE